MPLSPGDRLGPYEIVSAIGKGGMGEVWKARDPRLGRDVAIKVSAQQFTDRFEREARAIAALNHTNICILHDVGPNYLVMELIEGPTLADRIAQGPIPLTEALGIAKQIADALEAAHEKGITHRDLKPANVKIKPDGSVKVLDFGLAKSAEASEVTADSPTMLSSVGMILGTAGYMSPEQARGKKEVDKRADIWAFGVVLYEMLTGKRLFQGDDVGHTLASVIMQEPDLSAAPVEVVPLLKRCLEKDPKRRLRDIGDVWLLLQVGQAFSLPEQAKGLLHKGLIAAVAVLAVLLAALAFAYFRQKPPVAELSRFQIPMPAGLTFPGPTPTQEVSPDGRKLAFPATGADGKVQLWIRSFDSLDARPLPGVELHNGSEPFFWSGDSRFIAFQSPDNKLKKVDVTGGPAQTLCDVTQLLGGTWGRDGVILYGEGRRGVMQVPAAGGTPVALTDVDPVRQEGFHADPRLLPDGRHFLYFRTSDIAGNNGIYVGAIDAKASEQSSKPLLLNEAFPGYYVPSGNSGNGHLLFYREGTVLAQPFNSNKLELSGDPVPVAEQVGNVQGHGFFSASADNGVLIYVGGNAVGNAQLAWFDREGKNLGTVGEPGTFPTYALSRDGRQAAVMRADTQRRPVNGAGPANLWLLDTVANGAATRFTFDAFMDRSPVFSPDGSSVVFTSNRDGHSNLYRKLTSGIKDEELLLKSDDNKTPSSQSPDGRFLLYSVRTPKANKEDIWILPLEGSQRAPMLFQGTEFDETRAQFSPDGRWIAYSSDESGRPEVYVREFSLSADGKPEATAKHQISNGGGSPLRWNDDGKELIYVAADRRTIMSAEIATRPALQFSPGKALFQLPTTIVLSGVPAVDGAGKRFLAAMPASQNGPTQFTVVLNWQAGLKK
jgi:eukaryotic-like serine/threonine-protein kinase